MENGVTGLTEWGDLPVRNAECGLRNGDGRGAGVHAEFLFFEWGNA
jgi:hypothetical protein